MFNQKFEYYEMGHRHYHNHYEIYYLLSGERYYFIKDRSYHVKSGDIVLINKNDLHHTSNANDLCHEKIMIYFKEEYIRNLFNPTMLINLFSIFEHKNHIIRLNITDQELVQRLLLKLLDEYNSFKSSGEEFEEYKQEKLFHLKIMLTEFLYILKKIRKNQKEDFKHTSPLHKTISDIAQYITQNYEGNIKLTSIANDFSLNPCYLSSMFKEITGFSLIEYLNLTRIKEAKNLLNHSDLNITEISERVGFNTLSHFGRTFKKYNNISPSQYRKIHFSKN